MNFSSSRGKTFLLAAIASAALSACAGAAVIPAQIQTEQIKESEKTVDNAQRMVEEIEAGQQQRVDDLCSGALVEGFNC
jgi:outer membrane biogenesis lipoprotein LolB